MLNKNEIFPIGIGTWKIDYENIENDMKSLMYSYEKGQNYLSLYMMYNGGAVVRNLKPFVDGLDREKIFINVNIEPTIEKIEDIEKQLNEYLEILNLKYVDNLQLHTPKATKLPLIDTYKEMQRLVNIGKARYLGISNCNLEQIKVVNETVKIDFFEGVYNLECKINEDIGILEYCKENDITFVAYQALRRNRTAKRNYLELLELSKKYNKTQNQIILNWIVKEKNIKPLIKSTNIERINENLEAVTFEMEREDYQKLNNFRSQEFDNIKIDWYYTGNGVTIDQLANQFE
ncbi:MAG: aldo/keto reductase [Clostridia bacterium]|nr:aldo/keto reductase [Clostridia bacterium]